MKKGDYILIVSAILLSVVLFFCFTTTKANTVTVKENNKIVYEGSIKKDKTVSLKNNTVIIKNGNVYMKEANCKNKICVHTGKINKSGESIICLPNKVSVTVK